MSKRSEKLLEQRVTAHENLESLWHDAPVKKGKKKDSPPLGDIRCVLGGKVSICDPVWVTSVVYSNLGLAYQYNGSFELESATGVIGIAQQAGMKGDTILVRFSGVSLIRKEVGTVHKTGDIVWCNDNAYAGNDETSTFLTTQAGGVTHFQVLQDATSNDTVMVVKFLTDLSSRGVPVKIVADLEDPDSTETNLCDVYPFGPENSTVIHKRVTVKFIDDLLATFTVGDWYIATVIGNVAYTKEGGGSASRPFIEIKTVISSSRYTADILTSPFDNTVITAGVAVFAFNAVANSISVGAKFYADGPVDEAEIPTYIISPPVLS